MKEIFGTPRGYMNNENNIICCVNQNVITIDANGNYVETLHEAVTLTCDSTIAWNKALLWGKEPIILTQEQIAFVWKAIDVREQHMLDRLVHLSPEQFFEKIMNWIEHNVRFKENPNFKNCLGSRIFTGPNSPVSRLTVLQKDKVIKAYRAYNPKPDIGLVQLIKWAESNNKHVMLNLSSRTN